MNRTELDQLVAEHGAEVETNVTQDELCKAIGYKAEFEYLMNLMGVRL